MTSFMDTPSQTSRSRAVGLGWIWLLLGLLFLPGPGPSIAAPRERCRLERVLSLSGTSVVLTDVASYEGQPLPMKTPSYFELMSNGFSFGSPIEVKELPADVETQVIVAVEVSALYEVILPLVHRSVPAFIESLPTKSRVAVIRFGTEVLSPLSLLGKESAAQEVPGFSADEDGVVLLGKALRHAASLMRQGSPDGVRRRAVRSILVLLASGENSVLEHAYFRDLGDELRLSGVAVFPIGFAPQRERIGNLLHLGELAKRTGGTFRWAREPSEIPGALQSLSQQLHSTLALYFSEDARSELLRASEAAARLQLRCGSEVSNVLDGNASSVVRSASVPSLVSSAVAVGVVIAMASLVAAGLLAWRVHAARRQPKIQGARPRDPSSSAPQVPWLEPLHGVLDGRPLALQEEIILGSALSSDVVRIATDGAISSRHCSLSPQAAGVVLTDINSQNGTLVNGRKITAPVVLQEDDVVTIGNFTGFRFHAGSPGSQSKPARLRRG